MTHEIVITVLSNSAIGVLLLYIFKDITSKVKDNAIGLSDARDKAIKDLKEVEIKVDEVVYNYLKRFDEIKTIMSDNNSNVMKELGHIKTDVAVVQSNCFIIQKSKGKK